MSYLMNSGADTITFTNANVGALFDYATPLSFNFWIKMPAGYGTYSPFVSRMSAVDHVGAGNANGFEFRSRDVNTTLDMNIRDQSTTLNAVKASAFSTAVWVNLHITFVQANAVGTRTKLWVNGTSLAVDVDDNNYCGSADQPLIFQGNGLKIAEFAVWSGDEVTDATGHITALAGGSPASTVRPTGLDLYIPYGANANDAINGYTGTVTGATLDADHPFTSGGGGGGGAGLLANRIMGCP